jgi:hypothetical protein
MAEVVKGDGQAFWKLYRLVGRTSIATNNLHSPKRCRFCGNAEPIVSFKMAAHICPELLGENNFIGFEECDSCNQKFSAFESHLSKFFLPYLAILQIKGKKRRPDFHSRTEDRKEVTRTILRGSGEGKLELIIGKDDDLIIDKERKLMSVRFRLPPHKPLFVYKALVKIALSLLPVELVVKYQTVFDWLRDLTGDTAYFPMVFITRINNKRFAAPWAELYEANYIFDEKGFHPELTLILNFGNLVAQIFLPLSEGFDYPRSHQQSPQLEIYPAPVIHNQDKEKHKDAKPTDIITVNFHFTTVDLASDESCIKDEIIHFTFQDIQSNFGYTPDGL